MIAWLPWLVASHEVRSISTCELQTDMTDLATPASQESTFQLIPTCALPTELTQKDEDNDLVWLCLKIVYLKTIKDLPFHPLDYHHLPHDKTNHRWEFFLSISSPISPALGPEDPCSQEVRGSDSPASWHRVVADQWC
jgi:hypothetical protein